MSGIEDYDLVIIGSGAAGKLLAWTLAGGGKRVAVVERKYVGGSCPNIACLPSKNVIHSAKVASYLRRGEEFGLATSNQPVDMRAVRERKRRMVQELVELHITHYRESGAELVMGSGRFVAPRTVEVALNGGGTRTLRGQTVIINTGSRARIDADDTPGLSGARPLTHIDALELDQLPGHLIVLGGGYVGLEFAQAVRRFGSRVTVVERNGALLHREDPDVSEAIEALFRDEGIVVATSATLRRVEGTSGELVRLHVTRTDAADGVVESVIEGTHLLVASGRMPNTDAIGLDLAGVQTDARGHVVVNERLQTTADGVWAVGDCAGSPYFTHISVDDFRVVLDNLPGGHGAEGDAAPHRVTTGRQVPSCLFTDPELARVGLTEREAQARGIAYRLARIPMAHILRTHTLGETRGFMKALIEPGTNRVLGFTAFGAEAGEVVPAVQVAMGAGLPYTHLRDMVIAHPTVAEGLGDLFGVPLTDPTLYRPASRSRGEAKEGTSLLTAASDVRRG
jgi:pyruvate/2-oxoglutarate dehydrogenase complex dihydrolipoamide dehydrogenase (E3) component